MGASKTCLSDCPIFHDHKNFKPKTVQLICANDQKMFSSGTLETKIRVNDQLSFDINCIIVPNLSVPVILGMDAITSLSFDASNDFVFVNNIKVMRSDFKFGYLAEKTVIYQRSSCEIEILNPFFYHTAKNILVHPIIDEQGDFHVNTSIHNNDPKIKIIISNSSTAQVNLNKNTKICILRIQNINCAIQGIEIFENAEEHESLKLFQDSRRKEYCSPPKLPTIGKFGTITVRQKSELDAILLENNLAFSWDQNDLGCCHFFRFTIPLKDEAEIAYESPRPLPPALFSKVADEINHWLEIGIIKKATSIHNIPLIILKKANGKIRTSLDARRLNAISKLDRHPLPNLIDVINKIGFRLSEGKECFISQFDLDRAYWQIKVKDEDTDKVAFSFDNKQYQSRRVLYGLASAPSSYCSVIQDNFGDIPDLSWYLDDGLLISSTWEKHKIGLDKFFKRCISSGMLISASKSFLCVNKINFLGFLITKDGVKPSDKHILSIQKYPTPTTKKQLKSFLGLANFNGRLVKDTSVILNPLYKLTSIKKDFVWEKVHNDAFESFKSALGSTDGIYHRNMKYPLIHCSDASGKGWGSCLYQENFYTNQLEILGYASGIFSEPDSRLSARHRELLALTYGIRSFEYWLTGSEFTCVVDHQSLIYLLQEKSKQKLSLKLHNAMIYLTNYQFKVLHKPGNHPWMASPDALSRAIDFSELDLAAKEQEDIIPDKIFSLWHTPYISCIEDEPRTKIFLRSLVRGSNADDTHILKAKENHVLEFGETALTLNDLKLLQEQDDYCKNMVNKIKLKCKSICKKFKIKQDLLYQIQRDSNNSRLVIPINLGKDFIQFLHIAFLHPGRKRINQIISRSFFIHKIGEVCDKVISQCVTCLAVKPRPALRPRKIRIKHFESVPFDRTHVDIWDSGRCDSRGKRYLLAITCGMTGYVDGIALHSKNEKAVSEALLTLFLRNGVLSGNVIVSDGGLEWAGLWDSITKALNLNHVRTSAYFSQSNGKIERIFRELNIKFKLLKMNIKHWSLYMPYCLFIINNTPRESLDNITPCEAIYGRSLHMPYEYINDPQLKKENFLSALSQFINDCHPKLMEIHYNRYAKFFKRRPEGNAPQLVIGQSVITYKPSITNGKLSCHYSGPYSVEKRLFKDTYLLKCPTTRRLYRRNIKYIRVLPVEAELNFSIQNRPTENFTAKTIQIFAAITQF